MTPFEAGVEEFQWLLGNVVDVDELLAVCDTDGLDRKVLDELLLEAGRFIAGEIAPIRESSDRIGARLRDGRVSTPPGWTKAYRAWCESGWPALGAPRLHGGQQMPFLLQACVATMLGGADLAFAMVAVATRGASSVLLAHADADVSRVCVPRLATGEWTATIAITEAQAGSDVGLIATKAVPLPGGRFSLTGRKIFISGGDHDLTQQILHIVLARVDGARPGVKGLSLFCVPSCHFTPEGSLVGRNAITVSRIEEKMGLHGSPTCEVEFAGATGVMIGAEGAGLSCLFTMMNELRIEVGLNAVGICTSATAHAIAYAHERRQGRGRNDGTGPVEIADHPDVRRMLLMMRALTDGGRALVLETARSVDLARLSTDESTREHAQLRLDWLIPICKATLAENAVDVADIGIQIRGGHGYIRESGAEQFLRDSRVLPLYEGTNGIHAIDLMLRKLLGSGGRAYRTFVEDIRDDLRKHAGHPELHEIRGAVQRGVEILQNVSERLMAADPAARTGVLFGAKAYLNLAGRVAMAWMWLRMAAGAAESSDVMSREKLLLADFFARYYEPEFQLQAARVLAALERPDYSLESV